MNENSNASQPVSIIPSDDPTRKVSHIRPDEDQSLRHIALAGDTYTILLTGEETAGRYDLIDMHVPPGGGPPPHRHDFEEMFTLLEGEVEFTFRGEKSIVRAGETVNVPANAPHFFHNSSSKAARLLCMCTPSAQAEFFIAVGDPVTNRTATPPKLSEAEMMIRKQKAISLAPQYRTELLLP